MTCHNPIAYAFGRAASSYDEYALFQRQVADALFRRIAPAITPQAKWLDAGCGTGYFQELLRKHRHYNPLVQLDLALPMCRVAQNYAALPEYATTHTICADICALPFAPACFDGVWSSLALQWLPEDQLQEALQRLITHVKPGGVVALSTIGAGTLAELSTLEASLVNPFSSLIHWQAVAASLPLSTCQTDTITRQIFYRNVTELLRAIKGLGANRLMQKPACSSRTRRFFIELETRYQQQYGTDAGIPATWQAWILVGRKR